MYDTPSTIALMSFSPSTGKVSVQDLRLSLFFQGLTQLRRIVDAYLGWKSPHVRRWTEEPWYPVWMAQAGSSTDWWTQELTLDWAQLMELGTTSSMNLPPRR
jgi:hypothetical protein